MIWLWTLLVFQDPQADRVRAAMQASLDQQRASVQKQAQTIGTTIPWTPVAMLAPAADCDPVPQPQLSKMIEDASSKNHVDSSLITEVARQESGFKPCAVSVKGAQGLMQLMPETQAQFAVADPFDPQQSLQAGAKLLKQLLDRYSGDVQKALAAYNAGSGRVDQAGGVPEIPETKSYVFSILSRYLH